MDGTGASGGAVFVVLCEDTAELVIRWKETSTEFNKLVSVIVFYIMWCTGVTETVDLLQVKTRRGFSHCGRLNSGIKVPTPYFSLE